MCCLFQTLKLLVIIAQARQFDINPPEMLVIFLLVYLCHFLGLVAPLPIHHIAATFEHVERDLTTCECLSERRTVWAILWNCLATIFTCTWVSVHPNIPGPHDSEWKVMKRRAGLMIWAILAPEIVICWAIRQWIGARQLANKYHGMLEIMYGARQG